MRTSQSILVHEGHPGHGGVYILRGDQLSDRGPHAPPGGRPGRPAEPPGQSRRSGHPPGASREDRSARSAARSRGRPERGGRAAPGAGVLQRARWLRRRRARVRHRPRPGTVHPGAVAERDRQRVVRVPGLRVRVGLHLVREQPREPAHAVVQRPRQRPGERGDLRPRRRQRRAVGSDGPADPLRGIDVRRPSRCRLQPVRAPARRHRARPRPVRPARRPPEGLGADDREPIRALQAPVGDRLRRVGAGHLARGQRPPDRHGAGAGDAGASSCATRGTPSSAAGSPSSTSAGGRRRGRPIGPSSSAATALRTGPPAWTAGTGCREPSAPAWIRAPPCRPASSSPTERGPRSSCCSARRTGPRRRPTSSGAGERPTTRRRCATWRATGTTPRARSRCGHPTARWTSCSTAGSSTRRSPAGCGRGRRSTRPAAPTGSATSSRTSSPW